MGVVASAVAPVTNGVMVVGPLELPSTTANTPLSPSASRAESRLSCQHTHHLHLQIDICRLFARRRLNVARRHTRRRRITIVAAVS